MTTHTFHVILFGAGAVWFFSSFFVAAYASDKGFPFFPILLVAWCIGFPLPLLLVAIGAGPIRKV
jgi:hypothetical protein